VAVPEEIVEPVDSGVDMTEENGTCNLHIFDSSDDEVHLSVCRINGSEGTIGVDDEIRDDLTEGEYTTGFRFEFKSSTLALGQRIHSFSPLRLSPARVFNLPYESQKCDTDLILSVTLTPRGNLPIVFPFVMNYLK